MTSSDSSAKLPAPNDPAPIGAFSQRTWGKWGALAGTVVLALAVLVYLALSTWETRRAVRCYAQLTAAVNAQDIASVRQLCSRRYLGIHKIKKAAEGGIIGFPRTIHKNFQAWREKDAVWLCPTNRIGPIYQFVQEDGDWKYDGVIGLLRSGNQIFVLTDEARSSEDSSALDMP